MSVSGQALLEKRRRRQAERKLAMSEASSGLNIEPGMTITVEHGPLKPRKDRYYSDDISIGASTIATHEEDDVSVLLSPIQESSAKVWKRYKGMDSVCEEDDETTERTLSPLQGRIPKAQILADLAPPLVDAVSRRDKFQRAQSVSSGLEQRPTRPQRKPSMDLAPPLVDTNTNPTKISRRDMFQRAQSVSSALVRPQRKPSIGMGSVQESVQEEEDEERTLSPLRGQVPKIQILPDVAPLLVGAVSRRGLFQRAQSVASGLEQKLSMGPNLQPQRRPSRDFASPPVDASTNINKLARRDMFQRAQSVSSGLEKKLTGPNLQPQRRPSIDTGHSMGSNGRPQRKSSIGMASVHEEDEDDERTLSPLRGKVPRPQFLVDIAPPLVGTVSRRDMFQRAQSVSCALEQKLTTLPSKGECRSLSPVKNRQPPETPTPSTQTWQVTTNNAQSLLFERVGEKQNATVPSRRPSLSKRPSLSRCLSTPNLQGSFSQLSEDGDDDEHDYQSPKKKAPVHEPLPAEKLDSIVAFLLGEGLNLVPKAAPEKKEEEETEEEETERNLQPAEQPKKEEEEVEETTIVVTKEPEKKEGVNEIVHKVVEIVGMAAENPALRRSVAGAQAEESAKALPRRSVSGEVETTLPRRDIMGESAAAGNVADGVLAEEGAKEDSPTPQGAAKIILLDAAKKRSNASAGTAEAGNAAEAVTEEEANFPTPTEDAGKKRSIMKTIKNQVKAGGRYLKKVSEETASIWGMSSMSKLLEDDETIGEAESTADTAEETVKTLTIIDDVGDQPPVQVKYRRRSDLSDSHDKKRARSRDKKSSKDKRRSRSLARKEKRDSSVDKNKRSRSLTQKNKNKQRSRSLSQKPRKQRSKSASLRLKKEKVRYPSPKSPTKAGAQSESESSAVRRQSSKRMLDESSRRSSTTRKPGRERRQTMKKAQSSRALYQGRSKAKTMDEASSPRPRKSRGLKSRAKSEKHLQGSQEEPSTPSSSASRRSSGKQLTLRAKSEKYLGNSEGSIGPSVSSKQSTRASGKRRSSRVKSEKVMGNSTSSMEDASDFNASMSSIGGSLASMRDSMASTRAARRMSRNQAMRAKSERHLGSSASSQEDDSNVPPMTPNASKRSSESRRKSVGAYDSLLSPAHSRRSSRQLNPADDENGLRNSQRSQGSKRSTESRRSRAGSYGGGLMQPPLVKKAASSRLLGSMDLSEDGDDSSRRSGRGKGMTRKAASSRLLGTDTEDGDDSSRRSGRGRGMARKAASSRLLGADTEDGDDSSRRSGRGRGMARKAASSRLLGADTEDGDDSSRRSGRGRGIARKAASSRLLGADTGSTDEEDAVKVIQRRSSAVGRSSRIRKSMSLRHMDSPK